MKVRDDPAMASMIEWLRAGLAVYLRQLGQPESTASFIDECLGDAVADMGLGDFIGAGYNIMYAALFEKQDRTGEPIPPDAFLGLELDPEDPEPFTSMEFAIRHPRRECMFPVSEVDVDSLPSRLKLVARSMLSVVAEQHPEASLSELTRTTVEPSPTDWGPAAYGPLVLAIQAVVTGHLASTRLPTWKGGLRRSGRSGHTAPHGRVRASEVKHVEGGGRGCVSVCQISMILR